MHALRILIRKIKEVSFSVLPVAVIVLLLHFFVSPLETQMIIRFYIGAAIIILGLSIFLFGVDIGITPIGNLMGQVLTRPNKLIIVAIGGLLLGFFISVAEPDLHILAGQVDAATAGAVPKFSIIAVVSIGIAMLLAFGLIRIVYNIPLYILLAGLYAIVLLFALFVPSEFLAIAFDASGATTGALTVPFILALSVGLSAFKKDSKSSEKDSFGLVAIVSVGAIIAVLIMGITSHPDTIASSAKLITSGSTSLMSPFFSKLPVAAFETAIALAPLFLVFLVLQFVSFKLPARAFRRIIFGLVYAYIGLMLFLLGVGAGFMEVGSAIGHGIAEKGLDWLVVIVGFVLGLVTILAEPAVHVLTHEIEDVTSGSVKKRFVLIALCAGVGLAVAFSMLRIAIPGLQLWHFLLPGYVIALVLAFIGPKLFVGIAFDSGGVASGPMTATFILAFAQGAAQAKEGADILADGFGIIAMVALTPLITLQLLGLIYRTRSIKGDVGNETNKL